MKIEDAKQLTRGKNLVTKRWNKRNFAGRVTGKTNGCGLQGGLQLQMVLRVPKESIFHAYIFLAFL